MNRTFYLIAYDIKDRKRLPRVRHVLKGYSTGGQKSVYECFVTTLELLTISNNLKSIVNEDEDRVHIFRMDARSSTHTLGIALQPKVPDYFYIG